MAARPSEREFEEYVLLLLGPSGSGKSSAGNIIAGTELFPIRSAGLPTIQTIQRKFEYHRSKLNLIETVGFDAMRRSRMEFLIELTTAVLMAADAGGVHVFLICINLGSDPMFSVDAANALQDLEAMETIFSHAILVFMNTKAIGESVQQRASAMYELIHSSRCPATLRCLLDNVGDRKLVLEYDDIDFQRPEGIVRFLTVETIMNWTKVFERTKGFYTNRMMQEAKQLWEEYKLYVQEKAKYVPAPNPPSYTGLASWIVRNGWNVASGTKPFSQIYHGIQESRRQWQEAYTMTSPEYGRDLDTY